MEEGKFNKKEYQKQYDELNKDRIKEYHKNRYDNQDETFKKKYAKKNNGLKTKETIRKYNQSQIKKGYRKEWHFKQYKNDIQYKLSSILRSRFYSAIKNTSKSTSIKLLIGCNIGKLKQHIESQFKSEMNWKNHGDIWEIDHIKPISSFNLIEESQQKECFHYSNLQPLFKTTEIAESLGYKGEIGNRNKR